MAWIGKVELEMGPRRDGNENPEGQVPEPERPISSGYSDMPPLLRVDSDEDEVTAGGVGPSHALAPVPYFIPGGAGPQCHR